MILNKIHKLCPRCHELKPVIEFSRNIATYDGLQSYCKKCIRESCLCTKQGCYTGLHKRPYPLDGRCEICSIEFTKSHYHHWDDSNPSLGIWACGACDYLAEGLDEIEKNSWKVDVYRGLKREIEEAEKSYVYPGRCLPFDNIRRLYSPNGQLTYKWCPHCGKMLPVSEFYKNRSSYYGLETFCKECKRTYQIGCVSGHFTGLHKRVKPDYCELCNGKATLHYHHWDDNNRSKGVWVCGLSRNKCHPLAEVVDKSDNGSLLPEKYSKLKQEIIELEAENILLRKQLVVSLEAVSK